MKYNFYTNTESATTLKSSFISGKTQKDASEAARLLDRNGEKTPSGQ